VLSILCHSEYSQCPPVEALRRLHHWSNQCHRHQRSVPLQLTHQSDAASNYSHPVLLSDRFTIPDFIINCTEVRAVQWPEIWKFYGFLTLLHFQTGGSEWCTEYQGRHNSWKKI